MKTPTFDELPLAVSQLTNEVSELKTLVLQQFNQPAQDQDQWFDLNELVEYDPEKRTKPTFYGYIHKGLIPYHKRGKKLLFLKSEIDNWLKQGRKKTNAEIEADADEHLSKRKGGNR